MAKKKKKPAKTKKAKKALKTKKKVARKTSARKPAAKRPALKKPAVKKPAAKKPDSKQASFSLKEGDVAPSFTAKNQRGEVISLDQFRGKTVVLYFYPKDDTPGCTAEACGFRDNFARATAKGAIVLGVSKDDENSHKRFIEKYQLPFDLVVDADGKICEAYGVWKEKSMYGKSFMGIERSTFIISPDGKIRKAYPKVSVTGHVDDVLANL